MSWAMDFVLLHYIALQSLHFMRFDIVSLLCDSKLFRSIMRSVP